MNVINDFSEIASGWGPAVINDQQEHDFLAEGQKTFRNSTPYWVAGSTNVQSGSLLDNYSQYITADSGTISTR